MYTKKNKMVIRRKKFKDGVAVTQRKEKLSCRQRCMRKCRRSLCNKIKKYIKKKIFGFPDPHFSDFEIAGLSNIKSKLKMIETMSLTTLFKKNLNSKDSKWGISPNNADLIKSLSTDNLKKKYSIKGSQENVLRNMMMEYKTGKLSLSKLLKSKTNLEELDKAQLHEMMKNYESILQKRYKNLKAEEIKQKFSIKGSKEQVLEGFIEDLKKGKIPQTELSDKNKFNPKKLRKDQLLAMMQKYEEEKNNKKRNSIFVQSKGKVQNFKEDIKNNEQLNALLEKFSSLSANFIKKKYSVKGSQENVLRNMMMEYKTGKLSLSKLQKSKPNLEGLDKGQLHEMMKNYETTLQKKYENLNAEEIKQKFSIKGSKEQVLEGFIEDLKKGKISPAELSDKNKFNPKKLRKDQLLIMLQKYEEEKNAKKRTSVLKQSKEKIQNFMEDIKNNEQLNALLDKFRPLSVNFLKGK